MTQASVRLRPYGIISGAVLTRARLPIARIFGEIPAVAESVFNFATDCAYRTRRLLFYVPWASPDSSLAFDTGERSRPAIRARAGSQAVIVDHRRLTSGWPTIRPEPERRR